MEIAISIVQLKFGTMVILSSLQHLLDIWLSLLIIIKTYIL